MPGLSPPVSRPRLAMICLGVFALIHLGIVVINHYFFRTFAFDYGVYNYAFCDYAHLRLTPTWLYLTSIPMSFLQDHVSFSLMILSPLYWILQGITGTYTLLIIQWAFIVWGGYCTYRLIERKAADSRVAMCALIYYFCIYGRYSSYQADCNLAILGSALVPVFLYFFYLGRFLPSILVFIFLLLNREDFPLWMAFVCLFLVISSRKEKKQMALAGILLFVSILFFIGIFNFIIPALEDENKKFSLFNYEQLGLNPSQALAFIFNHPLETIKLLFINHSGVPEADWLKAQFYLVYGLSGGFVVLFRPVYLIVLVPLIAKKMLNDDANRWGYEMYYSVEVASVLPVLVYAIVADLKNTRAKITLSLSVCLLTILTTLYCFSIANYPGVANNKFNFLRASFYASDFPVPKLNRIIQKIPADAPVAATARIIPHLAMRQKIYFFPQKHDADYLCLYRLGDSYPYSQAQFDTELRQILESGLWTILSDEENLILLRRKTGAF